MADEYIYTCYVVVKVRHAPKDPLSVASFTPRLPLPSLPPGLRRQDDHFFKWNNGGKIVGIDFCVSATPIQTLFEPSQFTTMGFSHQWYPRHLTWAIVELADGTYMPHWFTTAKNHSFSSTTIESRKFRIPSDLRRQPGYRPVSSKVGDHLRILLGVVVYTHFLAFAQGLSAWNQ
jgi:hypothetical protein